MNPRFAFRDGERAALPAGLAAHASQLARLVIAIDGPAASGKSTTARQVATCLGSPFIDTGAMYRALALAAWRGGVDRDDGAALARLLHASDLRLANDRSGTRITWNGEDVTLAVRDPQVTALVSRVSAHPEVRHEMVQRQRRLGAGGGVLDGRDIGTVVFPEAPVKVYMTADVATRAARRGLEEAARGHARSSGDIESEIAARDAQDSTRAASPLRIADDAVILETSDLTPEDQADAVLALALRAIRHAAPRLVAFDPRTATQPGFRPFPSLLHRCVHGLLRWAAQSVFGRRIIAHSTSVDPPRGSVLVACNHVATLDPVVAGSALPFECWYIAKLELFRNPWFARLIARFNAIPIRRGTADFAALDRAVRLLQSGRSVFMFPEGTRQTPGKLGPPRWGFGYVAARAGRPIVPVFVRGTRDLRPRGLRREPMEVWIGEPFRIEAETAGDHRAQSVAVGELVMERIRGLMYRSAGRTRLRDCDPLAAQPDAAQEDVAGTEVRG
jgi:cytidylate kinase